MTVKFFMMFMNSLVQQQMIIIFYIYVDVAERLRESNDRVTT